MFRAPVFHRQIFQISAAWMVAVMAMLLATPDARAQQTFVCEDGGSVTVLPGQLELMKRTDPCVARHFQDALEPTPGSAWEAATAPPPGSAPMEAPLPEKKPETLLADAGAAGGDPTAAAQQVPPAEVKSDYRHVHIINAGSGVAQFYEHTR